MTVTRTTLPRWATDDVIDGTSGLNNVIEPSEAKKDVGWNYLEKPARQYFNWLGRQTNQWFNYLDEAVNFFAPYETVPATMAISLNAGRINEGTNVIEVAAQDTGVMTAPITNPRIDRIVISETTGLAAIVAGSESASPVAPNFDRDVFPIAQILLYVGMTEIVNADITDERSQAPFTDQLAADLFLTKPDSTGIGAYFQNSTTGSTAADGFFVGIDADEKALLWNYENTELLIAVNNALVGKVANDGKWLITPSGGDIATPTHELTVYNSLAASQSHLHFLNDGTGITSGDGFIIGINATERAEIWNFENTDLVFATNNIFRGKIDDGGKWLISTAGGDIAAPDYELTVYNSAVASSSYLQFLNDDTGTGTGNGFIIGISASEQAALINFENTDMLFYTNNVLRGKIDNGGAWLISPNGTDIEPAHDLVIYNSLAASDSFIQFINDGTGTTGADGLIVGIDPNEQAFIWNYENTDMVFATNNIERMRIESDGSVEIGTGLTNQGVGTLNVLNGLFVNNNPIGGTFLVTNTDLTFGTNNIFRGKVDNGGKWLISPDGTNIEPASDLVLYDNAGSLTNIQFCNSTTGITATDGFSVGIDSSERAIVWNYEATDLRFATANAFRGKIDNGGNWLISPTGADIEPSQKLTIYDNASQSAFVQFCNSTTGVAATDGFHVGLNTGEDAILWHYENEPMIFATNSLERMRIEADGSVEIGTGLTNQGVGTLNVLNGLYVNGSEIVTGSPQFVASGTTISIASESTTDVEITHGLGTDSVFVLMMADGNGSTNKWSASVGTPDNYHIAFAGELNTNISTVGAGFPTTGKVKIRFKNEHTSAQTISYRVLIFSGL